MTINRFDAEGKLSARITQITVPSFKQLADLAVQHLKRLRYRRFKMTLTNMLRPRA
ncbi:hypothetical protein [Pelosinus propionicus]|uniref:Uncharacterized protein n=1 Tax=Pelosinus propionicus DSM 13327 TaxID=1123291 RepID=A0A1I4HIM7_9FIRM|nr:hypothetical protein [Pelosinus propionicus]SFL42089.1 hypothetical protein SAMN04490355_100424 [Pelosinus propionicus DSM 13327]